MFHLWIGLPPLVGKRDQDLGDGQCFPTKVGDTCSLKKKLVVKDQRISLDTANFSYCPVSKLSIWGNAVE